MSATNRRQVLERGCGAIELTARQEQIIQIVKNHSPITGENIATLLNMRRASLRPDLSVLTMAGLLEARPRVGYFYSGKKPGLLAAEEMHRLTVDAVKAVPVVAPGDTSVYDCIVSLFTEDTGTLFIVSESGRLEGVVSRKDLLKAAMGRVDLPKIPVRVVMTRVPNVVTVRGDVSVYEAARLLMEHEIDSLPVIEPEHAGGKDVMKVTGRFTKTTVARIFVELGESGSP
jgi:CBS domain-containing protein